MRYFYLEKTYIYVGFKYDPSLVSMLKQIGGFFYNPQTKEWYSEISLDKGKLIERFLEQNDFVNKRPQPSLDNLTLPEYEEIISLENIKELINDLHLKRNLRDYQVECIHYLANHPNAINGCSPGLGKTGVSIVLVEALQLFPCLVVTPASVKYGWKAEWQKWVDMRKRKVQVLESKDKWKPHQDVYVLNYDILYKKDKESGVQIRFPELLEMEWESMFLDEAHMCKNKKSLRSEWVKKVAKKSQFIYPLTGTLVMNRPAELINILELTGWFKELFNDWTSFVYRYCNGKKRCVRGQSYGWDISCASNTLELNKIISNSCYFRKEKRDVLTELPLLIENVVPVHISNMKEYKRAENSLIDYLSKIDIERAEKAENALHLVKLSTLKELSLKGKMKDIEVFLNEWKEISEEKLLIFGVRREPLKKLAEKYRSPIIQGGMTAKDKFDTVQTYRTSCEQFLFANIDAVGTGVDGLQDCCSNLVYIELPDKFTTLDQTNSRLERMGQKNNINVFYLLCPDTIDTYMAELVEGKKKVTDAINKGVDVDVSEMDINFMVMKRLSDSGK